MTSATTNTLLTTAFGLEAAGVFAALLLEAGVGARPLAGSAAALALLNNAIEARTDSYKLLRCAQRPQPRLATHTGTWRSIWHFITLLSILTNTILVCHSSTALPTRTKGK